MLLNPSLIFSLRLFQVNVGEGFAAAMHFSVVEFPLSNSTDTCLMGVRILGASETKINSFIITRSNYFNSYVILFYFLQKNDSLPLDHHRVIGTRDFRPGLNKINIISIR